LSTGPVRIGRRSHRIKKHFTAKGAKIAKKSSLSQPAFLRDLCALRGEHSFKNKRAARAALLCTYPCLVDLGLELTFIVTLGHGLEADRLDPRRLARGTEGLVARLADRLHALGRLGEPL